MVKPDKTELRQFGLLLAGFIAAIWLLFAGIQNVLWMAVVTTVLILVSLVVPVALRPVHWLLLKFGHAVSKVLNPVLLGVVYFVIITPMGLAMKLFRYDPMRRTRDAAAESYREPSDHTETRRFDRPF